jgi:hypothetical protein
VVVSRVLWCTQSSGRRLEEGRYTDTHYVFYFPGLSLSDRTPYTVQQEESIMMITFEFFILDLPVHTSTPVPYHTHISYLKDDRVYGLINR